MSPTNSHLLQFKTFSVLEEESNVPVADLEMWHIRTRVEENNLDVLIAFAFLKGKMLQLNSTLEPASLIETIRCTLKWFNLNKEILQN